MSMNEPISFYIPARHAAETLEACIAAVRAQTRPADEVFILADPRSTDATMAIAQASGLHVIPQQGSTLGAARNEAIRTARHRWLACCDSDVVIAGDWLERLAALRGSGAAGIGGRTNEQISGPADDWRAMNMPHHWGDYPLRNPFMLVSEVLFDRRALLAVGGYRDDLNYHEDSDLCQRLRDAGHTLLYEPSAKATHLRRDSIVGLLTLRWKYSEYRQRHLLDRYAGLLDKTGVNREYALNTLARCLARGREDLSYISFLLYFHHLLLDHRSLLSRRALIDAQARAYYEAELVSSIVDAILRIDEPLGTRVRVDLGGLVTGAPATQAAAARTPINLLPETPTPHTPNDPTHPPTSPLPPAWTSYLHGIDRAVTRFLSELPQTVRRVIGSSAELIQEHMPAERMERLPSVTFESLTDELGHLPLAGFVDDRWVRQAREQWPNHSKIRIIGALATGEWEALEPAVRRSREGPPARLAVAPHLEARPDPLELFGEIDRQIDRLVACYQPPARLIPGLDIPSAADLASAAAAAGWTIERFETLVGRTQLMLSRPFVPSATDGARTCADSLNPQTDPPLPTADSRQATGPNR